MTPARSVGKVCGRGDAGRPSQARLIRSATLVGCSGVVPSCRHASRATPRSGVLVPFSVMAALDVPTRIWTCRWHPSLLMRLRTPLRPRSVDMASGEAVLAGCAKARSVVSTHPSLGGAAVTPKQWPCHTPSNEGLSTTLGGGGSFSTSRPWYGMVMVVDNCAPRLAAASRSPLRTPLQPSRPSAAAAGHGRRRPPAEP